MLPLNVAEHIWKIYQKHTVPIEPKGYRLENLICQQFVPDRPYCTSVGENIARSFIIASGSKIFKEPDRAIIELPLNSIDAYRALRGKPSIGKFGMGFYSIFIYIIGHSKRKIVIESRTLTDNWTVTLTYDQGIVVNYQEPSTLSQRGTTIRIIFDGEPYDQMEIILLLHQYLSFIPDVKIYLNEEFLNRHFYREKTDDTVWIKNSSQEISITDHGTGISKEILFSSLLVPGSSSKGIKYSPLDLHFRGPLTGHHPGTLGFFILVGDIPIFRAFNTFTLLIQMPSNTPLPVSRDNIIWNPETIKVFLAQCQLLLDDLIVKNLIPTVSEVIATLRNFAPTLWMREFTEIYLMDLPTRGIYLIDVPEPVHALLVKILPQVRLISVSAGSHRADHFAKLEDLLLAQKLPWINDLFLGKSILPVQEIQIYTGFIRVVLLNHNLVNDPEAVIRANPEEQLERGNDKSLNVNQIIMRNFYAKTKGLEYTFILPSGFSEKIFYPQLEYFLSLDRRIFDFYISKTQDYYNRIVKETQASQAYGGGRGAITMQPISSYSFVNELNDELRKKLASFLLEVILDSFDFFRRTQARLIPTFWKKGFIPVSFDVKAGKEILKLSPNIYVYMILTMVQEAFEKDTESSERFRIETIPTLIEYYQAKIDNVQARVNIMFAFHQGYKIGEVSTLKRVYRDLNKPQLIVWKNDLVGDGNNQYLYSELLERAFAPDFEAEEILGLKTKTTVKSNIQLIQIAAIPFTKPFRETIFALLSNVNKGDYPEATLEQDANSLVFSLNQQMPINLLNLLSASIPFSSTGSGLGIGIFRVLTAVNWLRWDFRWNNKIYTFLDTPILRNGQVVDVLRKIYVGTYRIPTAQAMVTVSFRPEYSGKLSIFEANYLFKEVVSLTRNIDYQGKTYKNVKSPYKEQEDQMTMEYIPGTTSWYFVNGFPVTELEELLDELYPNTDKAKLGYQFLATEILIDSPTPIRKHNPALQDLLYYGLCAKYLHLTGNEDLYLSNSNTRHAKQIRMRTDQYSVVLNIPNEVIGVYRKSDYSPTLNQIINKLLDTNQQDLSNLGLREIESNVLEKWFSNKDEGTQKEATLEATQKGSLTPEEHEYYVAWHEWFINKYWATLVNLGVPELKVKPDPPTVDVKKLKNAAGLYYPALHKIEIDESVVQKEYLSSNVEKVKKNINDYNNGLYALMFPATTLVHELYHAVLSNAEGFHPDMKLTIGGEKKIYNFDQGATEIYKQLILRNFLN